MVTCIPDTLREYVKVFTSVEWFSFFCENQLVLVFTLCYENLISSLIYIYIYRVGEKQSGSHDFYFFQIHSVLK